MPYAKIIGRIPHDPIPAEPQLPPYSLTEPGFYRLAAHLNGSQIQDLAEEPFGLVSPPDEGDLLIIPRFYIFKFVAGEEPFNLTGSLAFLWAAGEERSFFAPLTNLNLNEGSRLSIGEAYTLGLGIADPSMYENAGLYLGLDDGATIEPAGDGSLFLTLDIDIVKLT